MTLIDRITRELGRTELGQDMVEYALIMALVSVIAVGAVALAGQSVLGLWTRISAGLPAF